MFRRAIAAGALVLALTSAAACGDDSTPAGNGRARVVAAFYPLQFISERLGGDGVGVTNLTKPGAEPHDLELQPSQLATIEEADLIVYIAGFQPAVDDAVKLQKSGKAFDVAGVEPLSAAPSGSQEQHDPHVWLDPIRLAAIVGKLADRMATLAATSTDQAALVRSRAGQLQDELRGLDQEYATGLRDCDRHDIVTNHAAFGYLAARYKLRQIPITGINPDEEPSPQQVSDVAKLAKDKGVTTIFFESLVSPKLSETVAKEIGATAAVLDPIEGVEGPGTYFSVMRSNLAALRTALGCR